MLKNKAGLSLNENFKNSKCVCQSYSFANRCDVLTHERMNHTQLATNSLASFEWGGCTVKIRLTT